MLLSMRKVQKKLGQEEFQSGSGACFFGDIQQITKSPPKNRSLAPDLGHHYIKFIVVLEGLGVLALILQSVVCFFLFGMGTVQLFFTGDSHQVVQYMVCCFILKNNCYLSDVMFSFKDEERSH